MQPPQIPFMLPPLMLGDSDLQALGLEPHDIVDAIEAAVQGEIAGRVWTTAKSALTTGDGRYMMTTLSASDTPPVSVVKFVMVSPDNPGLGLPSINGSILLHDSRTGLLRAVLDANWITGVRTAGLSGVVARHLASPGSARIGFVGTGVQARSHLDLFGALYPLRAVTIFGRGQANIDLLADRARAMGLDVMVCDTPRAAVEAADIVVTSVPLTSGVDPFLDARWLKPGAFASITDTGVPWRSDTLPGFGRIVIDDCEQEAITAKKMLHPDLITTDLRGLVGGDRALSFDPAQTSAFLFRGLAIGDFAVSALAWERATEQATEQATERATDQGDTQTGKL